jgi:hypothetical protein
VETFTKHKTDIKFALLTHTANVVDMVNKKLDGQAEVLRPWLSCSSRGKG